MEYDILHRWEVSKVLEVTDFNFFKELKVYCVNIISTSLLPGFCFEWARKNSDDKVLTR